MGRDRAMAREIQRPRWRDWETTKNRQRQRLRFDTETERRRVLTGFGKGDSTMMAPTSYYIKMAPKGKKKNRKGKERWLPLARLRERTKMVPSSLHLRKICQAPAPQSDPFKMIT